MRKESGQLGAVQPWGKYVRPRVAEAHLLSAGEGSLYKRSLPCEGCRRRCRTRPLSSSSNSSIAGGDTAS